MVEIELSPFDKKDLLEMLDYASEMKQEHRPPKKVGRGSVWDDTDYWVMRIEQLKQLINGKKVGRSLYGSTLPDAEPHQEEKNKQYYQKRKRENDVFNGKDWYEHDPF